MAHDPLPTRYQPAELEPELYALWLDSGRFAPPAEPGPVGPFTVMMPPPNVTGVLHMGHALNNTLQDVVVRHRRMLGHDTLWLPGTDHAGIATQAVVEKKLLQEEGRTREEVGRTEFVQRIWEWKEHHGGVILEQLKRIGASCDWSRTRFTLDPAMSRAVRVAFVRLWEKGLVYRGARLVNWDCKLRTAVSDDEIEYVERKGKLWTIRYPRRGRPGEFLTVATTRPETLLGDTGVAVHPDDERWRDWVGAELELPLLGRTIPVVADEAVERSFGTGAVKLTPGHDPADYAMGARHGLPIVNLLEPDGTLTAAAGPYAGLTREAARERVLADLEAAGLLVGEEECVHNVPISDRSKTAVEPLVSEQWFVKMAPLAEPAIAAVKDGSLRFKPERWTKVYLDWLENVHDWCISRQLWWGHRIPVWYDEDGVPVASVDDLEIGAPHPVTGKPIVRQDDDVLDTWASSWLWPFATLGWPEPTEDLLRFYPTQFLSTARDIIYLWVARMVMAGYEFVDHLPPERRCPFATCYVHATVLDAQGRRMSKSLGNGIDPVEMIERYGADAVRYSLMILTREGQDVKLAENRFELGQRFCNKVWNAARFVLGHLGDEVADAPAVGLADRWIRHRLDVTVAEVSRALEDYDFHDAATALYRFTWDDFCDWYLEAVKPVLRAGGDEAARVRRTLGTVLARLLALLHPFVPFLTEAVWQRLPETFRGGADLLMTASWPTPDAAERDAEAARAFDLLRGAVRALRNLRALLDLPTSARPDAEVRLERSEDAAALAPHAELLAFLAGMGAVVVAADDGSRPEGRGTDVFEGGAVFLPYGAEADLGKLRDSLARKLAKVEKGLAAVERKLANERFVANADPEVVAGERERRDELAREAEVLRTNLDALAGAA